MGGGEVGDLFVISVIKSSSAEVAYRIGAGTIVTNRISINLWSACEPTSISFYFYSVICLLGSQLKCLSNREVNLNCVLFFPLENLQRSLQKRGWCFLLKF